jgi:hypothetical protein
VARAGSLRARAAPWALVLGSVAVMCARRPEYFTAPGFWAEEGFFYFAGARGMPWYRALLWRPTGYITLYTNVAALGAAYLVPLQLAPLVTTVMALAVQTVPLVLIALGRAPAWEGVGRKAVGMAIVLFGALTGEIWLNTINSQFYFALIAILLLLEPSDVTRLRAAVYAVLLAAAGLTGPVACSLAPLFVAKAWRCRRSPARIQAAVIVTCAAAQVAASLAAAPALHAGARRMGLGVASAALVVWMKTIVLPVAGGAAAIRFVTVMGQLLGGDLTSPAALAVGLGLLGLAAVLLAWLSWDLRPLERLALGGGWALITTCVILGALGDRRMFLRAPDASSRYFYVPGVVLLMLLLANVRASPGRRPTVRSVGCALLLALGLGMGAVRYRSSLRWQPSWPRWEDEVHAWERDPRHALQIWPPGWTVHLAPRLPGRPPNVHR